MSKYNFYISYYFNVKLNLELVPLSNVKKVKSHIFVNN